MLIPRWAVAYIPPLQRFEPMPFDWVTYAISAAREQEIRNELTATECPWPELEESDYCE